MDLKEGLIRGLAILICIILLIYTAYWGVNQMRLRIAKLTGRKDRRGA